MQDSITELAKQFPGVAITIPAEDLEKFGNNLVKNTIEQYRAEIAAKEAEARQEKLLTAKEVAEFFGISTKTVTRWRDRGQLTPVYVGGLIKYRKSECLRILEDQQKA